ncbi:hypothetical protein [Microbacterium trichothecenolyticum]|uniref:Uncharacterized protein n=1 Tax=Microbacterium trichothecenolyticum TaxID=69370 RepID=A0ABU0TUB0_MICTR|nr:hypothetical protein [Microbacterium trichothecenolyticum]MDQ1123251.1 hypothetical protein [Microbacterium trichothecenolyticum]
MNRRRIRQIATWVAPLLAVVIVLSVLKGAGVPLSVPGVVLVFVVLFVARVLIGRGRRRKR